MKKEEEETSTNSLKIYTTHTPTSTQSKEDNRTANETWNMPIEGICPTTNLMEMEKSCRNTMENHVLWFCKESIGYTIKMKMKHGICLWKEFAQLQTQRKLKNHAETQWKNHVLRSCKKSIGYTI